MNKLKKIFLIFLSVYISGCAYYNMYFNAEKNYRDAENKRKMTNKIDKNLYENSLKELSKILEFYPDSKWVDDALLMMGQCYYRQEKYDKAKRKYMEIISNYPNSDLQSKARALLAEVEIALNNYDAAVELIESIKIDNVDIDPLELKNLNAELSLSTKDSSKALNLYMEAVNESDSPGDKITYLNKASKLADEIRNHKLSADIYAQLIDNSESREKKFEYTLKLVDALEEQGHSDSALVIIENILSIEEYDQYSLEGDIKLGELYYLIGEYEKSYEKLDEILRTNQKKRENGAFLSETAFYMGEYYFNYKKDLESAITMYDSSGYYDRSNESYKASVERKKIINEFQRLKKKIPTQEVQIDTLKSKINRVNLKLEAPTDSTDFEANNKLKELKKKLGKDLKNKSKEITTSKMLLAEKYLYDIVLPDSAENCLIDVSLSKVLPHTSSRALLMLYNLDSIKYSSIQDSIIINYPKTHAANAVRKIRGLELETVIEDSAEYYFNIASDIFLDSLYTEAIDSYLSITDRFEDSPLSPKIMKAAGLIAENYIVDLKQAEEIYTKLKEKYPRSSQGNFASNKLKMDSSKRKERPKKVEETEADRWYLMDRRNR